MTNVEYTYEIVRVDSDTKTMDILYMSNQYGSILVGARMPWETESINDVVIAFSPVRYWLDQAQQVATVEIGASGSIQESINPSTPSIRSASKISLVRAMRDINYNGQSLWDAAKAQLALADEQTQEDWMLASTIMENDPVFVAMATTLYGDGAQAAITALFDAAGAPS